jgi:hypothetical protein
LIYRVTSEEVSDETIPYFPTNPASPVPFMIEWDDHPARVPQTKIRFLLRQAVWMTPSSTRPFYFC